VRRADTIEGLARQIGVPEAGLAETVRRFNSNAAQGVDPDFGRGQSAYNRCLGDPGYKPNPALGPLDRAPFYAAEIFPGDVGTCGGLVTDEHARVLGAAGSPIPGLYATGNITATVMGRTYPGAGASIGNTMVFGFVAARHAASADQEKP
jgi:3-oxosteroid 1-dehydrogenase